MTLNTSHIPSPKFVPGNEAKLQQVVISRWKLVIHDCPSMISVCIGVRGCSVCVCVVDTQHCLPQAGGQSSSLTQQCIVMLSTHSHTVNNLEVKTIVMGNIFN